MYWNVCKIYGKNFNIKYFKNYAIIGCKNNVH